MITATIVFLFILGVLGSVGTWTFFLMPDFFCWRYFIYDCLSLITWIGSSILAGFLIAYLDYLSHHPMIAG